MFKSMATSTYTDRYWPLAACQFARFSADWVTALWRTSHIMNTKYYRYQLIPELEERGEVEAAKAISALSDVVDNLQAKVQAQLEQIKTLRYRDAQ